MSTDEKTPHCEKTYRIALYQHIKHGWASVFETYQDGEPVAPDGYMRLSEMVEVRFAPLSTDEGLQQAHKALDEAEKAARLELAQKLREIGERRADLLALTHQPAVIDSEGQHASH